MYKYLAIALLFFSVPALSAETRPYMYRAQQTAQLQELINRGSVPVTYETVATTPTGQQVTRYTTRATAINTARLGSLARSATGGPAVLAATAAFLAYDYFYNESTGDWEIVIPADEMTIDSENICSPSTVVGKPSTNDVSFQQCIDYILPYAAGGSLRTYSRYTKNCTSAICTLTIIYRQTGTGSEGQTGSYRYPAPRDVLNPLPSVDTVPDFELGDAVKNAPPRAVSDILNDPISSGTWPDRWPEMVPTVQDISDNLGHEIEGAPAPVSPDQTIIDGSTARPSGSDSGSGGVELPPFCDWVPDWLCDLIDLPEHPEVPFVDIDEPDSFESGIGAGQCPADNVVATRFGFVPISWALPCQLAETFRPVVLFFAWITALYIVVRVK